MDRKQKSSEVSVDEHFNLDSWHIGNGNQFLPLVEFSTHLMSRQFGCGFGFGD